MVFHKSSIIIIIILVFILLLLYKFNRRIVSSKWYRNFKEWFSKQWIYKIFMRIPPSEGVFQIAWDGALFFAAFYVALYTSNQTRILNMTTLFVIFCICIFVALLYSIRNSMRPKDTRLDILITKVDTLTASINKLIQEIEKDRNEQKKERDEMDKERKELIKAIENLPTKLTEAIKQANQDISPKPSETIKTE